MNSATTRALDSLLSLYEAHKKLVLESQYLHVDETGIRVLDETKKGASHNGFYWVYRAGGGHGHNSNDKMVLFDYRTGRGREGPDDILKDFQGYLQVDGYKVYVPNAFGMKNVRAYKYLIAWRMPGASLPDGSQVCRCAAK